VLPEERTLCWILSERGVDWRDRQIKHGALKGLDKRFDSLAQVHLSRMALIEAMELGELAGHGKRQNEIQLPLVEVKNAC
jgi:hypothetical protein